MIEPLVSKLDIIETNSAKTNYPQGWFGFKPKIDYKN